jgi:hypothetical protein
VKQVVVMYITTKRRDVELDRASIKLELPDFLKLYDPVNAPVLPATVPSSSTPVRRSVFADCAGPFNCTLLKGDVLQNEPLRCMEAHDVISLVQWAQRMGMQPIAELDAWLQQCPQRTRRRTANGSNTVQKASHRGRLMGYLDRADYQRASQCSSVGVTLCNLMTDDACGRVVAHVRISVMHNNLQASVRVEYAFYSGQSLQYD